MEKETNCKISIRGKGSVKEGRGRKDPKLDPDADDELHVHVCGDCEEDVEKAVTMIKPLLAPMDDAANEHKIIQLRELAAINGTLREEKMCIVCGESGHNQWDCPQRTGAAWKPAGYF